MALGKILRETREELGLSATDVAEQTNMMVQIVRELENEDFHRIAAPIYGRGFLKLYAELLRIDVQPLIEEFMDLYTGKIVPELRKRVPEKKEDAQKPVAKSEEPPVKPVAIKPASTRDNPVQSIPQHVEIKPNQAVRKLELRPQPALANELPEELPEELPSEQPSEQPREQPSEQTWEQPSEQTREQPREQPSEQLEVLPEPAIVRPPVAQRKPLPVVEIEKKELSSDVVEEPVAPDVGDDLFDKDEPNLFNTSPLQERIAEARRLMDEKSGAGKSQDNKSEKPSLHLGTNQKLPIFQIGGRMDTTYEAEPKGIRLQPVRKNSLDSILKSLNRGVDAFCRHLPFKVDKKSFYIYTLLGIILIVFLVVGISVLFRLTSNPVNPLYEESGIAEAVEVIEPVRQAPVVEGSTPPPPDMFFD